MGPGVGGDEGGAGGFASSRAEAEDQRQLEEEEEVRRKRTKILKKVPRPETAKVKGWDVPVQPSPKRYRGMGLAEPSVWLYLTDPKLTDKFMAVFHAHTESFRKRKRVRVRRSTSFACD